MMKILNSIAHATLTVALYLAGFVLATLCAVSGIILGFVVIIFMAIEFLRLKVKPSCVDDK